MPGPHKARQAGPVQPWGPCVCDTLWPCLRWRSPESEARFYHRAWWPARRWHRSSAELLCVTRPRLREQKHLPKSRGEHSSLARPPPVASAPHSDPGEWTATPWVGSWLPTGNLRAFQLQGDGLGPKKTPISCVFECGNLTFEKARDLEPAVFSCSVGTLASRVPLSPAPV